MVGNKYHRNTKGITKPIAIVQNEDIEMMKDDMIYIIISIIIYTILAS